MAEITTPILSVCVTSSSKVKDLSIKNGQLVFVQDTGKIALDYGNKRVFYNQIHELATEQDRTSLLAPVSGYYYFVIGTAVLWTYQDGNWIQITTPPEDIVFIGTEMPELGSERTLYIDKLNKKISVWDNEITDYLVIAEETQEISAASVASLFL